MKRFNSMLFIFKHILTLDIFTNGYPKLPCLEVTFLNAFFRIYGKKEDLRSTSTNTCFDHCMIQGMLGIFMS